MEEVKYLHWQDYYKNTWSNDYNNMQLVINDESKTKLDIVKSFNKFWSSTIFLLQTYLRNYGQFYNGNTMIIKIAFRCDFINDGDAWILINDMVLNYKKYTIDETFNYCIKEKFEIFEVMRTKFEELLKEND